MKDGLIHICFVLDESGSMMGSESDVKGGFKKVIEEYYDYKDKNAIYLTAGQLA